MAWFNGKEGRWITVRGTHIFLENGKDPQEAIKERFSDAFDESYEYDDKYESPFDRGYKLYKSWNGYQRTPNFYDQFGIDVNLNDTDVFEILNNENLSEDDIKRQLGIMVAPDESISSRYQIGTEILRDYRKEYTQILREREKAKFAPRVKKAEEYLDSIGKKFENWDNIPISDKIDYANTDSNYNNYNLSRRFVTNPKKYDEYTSNCQRCVMAWYLNMLGYDVEAMPYDGDEYRNQFGSAKSNRVLYAASPRIGYDFAGGTMYRTNWSFSGFNIPKDTMYDYKAKEKEWASTQFKNLSKMVSESPNGSVYFCSVKWRGYHASHVFIIYNNNGSAKFIDPQDNSDASKYFDKDLYRLETGETTALRVNDFSLNGDTLNQIVRKKGEAKRLYDEDQAKNYKSI